FAHHQRLAGERQPRRGQRQPAHERQRHRHQHARRAGAQDPAGCTFARHGRRRLLSALGLRPYRYRSRALLVGTTARIEVGEGDITSLNKNGAQPILADRPTISARKTSMSCWKYVLARRFRTCSIVTSTRKTNCGYSWKATASLKCPNEGTTPPRRDPGRRRCRLLPPHGSQRQRHAGPFTSGFDQAVGPSLKLILPFMIALPLSGG